MSTSAKISLPPEAFAYDRANTVDEVRHSSHAVRRANTFTPVVMNDLVSQLTDGQRDCLRLVYRHMTSKDIARALDISPHTVDMRLRTAMKTLAVLSRIDAARLLVESEGEGGGYQSLIYQAPDVAEVGSGVRDGGSASAADDDFADQRFSPQFRPDYEPPASGPPRSAGASLQYGDARFSDFAQREVVEAPEILPWGRRNTLTPGARIAWIAGIAIGSALGFGAIIGALEALKNLL